MKLKSDFTIVKVVDDYMVVPIGEAMATFGGTVMLNEVSATILENMKEDCSIDELANLLVQEYDVDFQTALQDVKIAVDKFEEIGLVE